MFNDVERSNIIFGRIQIWETGQGRATMIGDIFWVVERGWSGPRRRRIWHFHFTPILHPHIYPIGTVTPSVEYPAGVRSSENIAILTPPSSNIISQILEKPTWTCSTLVNNCIALHHLQQFPAKLGLSQGAL